MRWAVDAGAPPVARVVVIAIVVAIGVAIGFVAVVVVVVVVVAVNEPEFAGKMDHWWSWMEKLTDVQTVDISGGDPGPVCPAIECTGWFYCLAKWIAFWVRFRGGSRLAYRVVLIVSGFCSGPRSGKFAAAADRRRRPRCPCGTDCTADWG